MAEVFSLKDQLFNQDKLIYLSRRLCGADAGFDGPGFVAQVMARLPELELKQRINWIADCLAKVLPDDFPAAAKVILASLPAPLDPAKTDDDFGDFIFAPFGEYVVRHGIDHHLDLSLDLLESLTQRFSMEFAIRPFLNRWPDQVLARMQQWADHDSYHVRRLVSEGTRAKLPWGMKIAVAPTVPVALLDRLYADRTRFVTRSVANHLNDLSKVEPTLVYDTLSRWQAEARQCHTEMAWITKHALRSVIKNGDPLAMQMLGFCADAPVHLSKFTMDQDQLAIGDTLAFSAILQAEQELPVLVDFLLHYHRPSGKEAAKVFKLKQAVVRPGKPLHLKKTYHLKGNATTFTLHPGPHRLSLQVNGRILGSVAFDLSAER